MFSARYRPQCGREPSTSANPYSSESAQELVAGLDVDILTRAVQAALNGSLFVWATLREGSAADWVRGDVDAVLAPYRAGG